MTSPSAHRSGKPVKVYKLICSRSYLFISMSLQRATRTLISTFPKRTYSIPAAYTTRPIHIIVHRLFSTTCPTRIDSSKMAGDGKITSWASNDGSFKRQTSSFRDVIEKGGKFEPEKGEFCPRSDEYEGCRA